MLINRVNQQGSITVSPPLAKTQGRLTTDQDFHRETGVHVPRETKYWHCFRCLLLQQRLLRTWYSVALVT